MTHYVVVRRDLPIGLKVAQTVHAAGESSGRVPSGTAAVALEVEDEAALVSLHERCADIPHVLIREASGEAMAIGFEPVADRAPMRRHLSSLPLVR